MGMDPWWAAEGKSTECAGRPDPRAWHAGYSVSPAKPPAESGRPKTAPAWSPSLSRKSSAPNKAPYPLDCPACDFQTKLSGGYVMGRRRPASAVRDGPGYDARPSELGFRILARAEPPSLFQSFSPFLFLSFSAPLARAFPAAATFSIHFSEKSRIFH